MNAVLQVLAQTGVFVDDIISGLHRGDSELILLLLEWQHEYLNAYPSSTTPGLTPEGSEDHAAADHVWHQSHKTTTQSYTGSSTGNKSLVCFVRLAVTNLLR